MDGECVQRIGGCGPAGGHPQPLSQWVGAQPSCSHVCASATKNMIGPTRSEVDDRQNTGGRIFDRVSRG